MNIYYLSLILSISSFMFSYKNDMKRVSDFFVNNYRISNLLIDKLGENQASEAMAIVSPEIYAYSLLADKAETYILKVLYTQTGMSDFSIGHFQMKPSFAEQIEIMVSNDECLRIKYDNLLIAKNTDQAIRTERVERLSSLKYQTMYLAAFYDIASRVVKTWDSSKLSQRQKLKNIATLYNGGLNITESEALNLQGKKQFPSMSSVKYNYADIVIDYYNYLYERFDSII